MKNSEEKHIIFVCTGNTCRSPMAEAIFRYESKRRGLTVTVSSAGTAASGNTSMHLYSLRTLLNHGLSIDNFVPTQLTDERIQTAFAVVCMTEQQKTSILDYCQRTLLPTDKKVYAFSDFCGVSIPDPYGLGQDAYEATYLALEGGMSALIETLFPVTVPKKKTKTVSKKKSTGTKKPAPKKEKEEL